MKDDNTSKSGSSFDHSIIFDALKFNFINFDLPIHVFYLRTEIMCALYYHALNCRPQKLPCSIFNGLRFYY